MPDGIPDVLTSVERGLYSSVGSMVSSGIGADRAFSLLREIAAQPYVQRGLSLSDAIAQAQQNGEVIARSAVRQIAREIRASLATRPELARLNPDNPIPARLAPESSQLKAAPYLTSVAISLVDRDTGAAAVSYFHYKSDHLPTPNEVYNAALTAAAEGGSAYGGYYEFDILAMGIYASAKRK